MTQPHYQDEHVTLFHGDCLDVLRELPDASVHSVVTDPPYGLEFMGKDWDAPWEERDVNADAGFHGGGVSATRNAPSFTGSTNPKCLTCKGTRRGRRDGTAKVAVCLCPDGGRFPNVRAVEMRAFQDWCELWATECLRVLKPGGHLLAFGGSRTWHRLASAIEDAGFEIRDSIAWLYGSGFPKSLDVAKAITGAQLGHGSNSHAIRCATMGDDYEPSGVRGNRDGVTRRSDTGMAGRSLPLTPDAERWQGWGTALKPAFEPIVVARKPLAGTVAANVLAHGTGALNIDGCRVPSSEADKAAHAAAAAAWSAHGERHGKVRPDGSTAKANEVYGTYGNEPSRPHDAGRWPTNVVLDDTQAGELDRQSGVTTSRIGKPRGAGSGDGWGMTATGAEYDDQGGASRFFPTFRYEPKAPTSERPRVGGGKGSIANQRCRACGKSRISGNRCECPEPAWEAQGESGIAHPTVKPLNLMRWLVRLVTPPGGVVLEPFAGSGTTAEACVIEGFRCIAIEREADYLPLIMQRLEKPIQPALDLDGGAA